MKQKPNAPRRPQAQNVYTQSNAGDHRESMSAVENFNRGFGQRAQRALDGDEAAPEEKPAQAEAPRTTDEEILEERSYNDFVDAAAFSIERDRAMYEVLSQNLARARQIEDRLEPLRFEDALLVGRVEQTIPIDPDRFVLTMRARSIRVSNIAKAAAAEVAKDEAATPSIVSQNQDVRLTLEQLAEISVSLVSFNGREIWPSPIENIWDTRRPAKDRVQDVKENILFWMDRDTALVVEIYAHLVAFDFRYRKVMQTTGYLESTVKNS